jgi:tmRNA-binding protein
MKNVSISGIGNDNIKRDRKLLLKKRELNKIRKEVEKGLSIIPSKLYENERGRFKVEIILGRGKKSYDKRETIKSYKNKSFIRQLGDQENDIINMVRGITKKSELILNSKNIKNKIKNFVKI